MASVLPPTRGTAFTITFPLFDTSGKLKTGAAFTSTQISKDNAGFGAATNAPAELATASGVYTLALTAAEMTADIVTVKMVVSTASTQDATVIIYTTARRIDDLAFPATSGRSMVVDAAGLVDANVVKLGPSGAGTAQTARDIGAGVIAATVSDKTGYALTAGEESTIATTLLDLANGVESGAAAQTVRQALRVILAAVAGKADGFPSSPVHFRDANDTKNRITATTDANGNRTAVTIDGT